MQNKNLIQEVRGLVDSLKSAGFQEAIIPLRVQIVELLDYIDDVLSIKADSSESKTEKDNNIEEDKSQKLSYYSPDWSFVKKFIFVLKSENRFIHFREAAEIVAGLEDGGDVDDLTHKLSNSTRKLKVADKIIKVQHGNSLKNTFWGLPKWLNENGEIKKGHEYKSDVLLRDKSEDKSDSLFDL